MEKKFIQQQEEGHKKGAGNNFFVVDKLYGKNFYSCPQENHNKATSGNFLLEIPVDFSTKVIWVNFQEALEGF